MVSHVVVGRRIVVAIVRCWLGTHMGDSIDELRCGSELNFGVLWVERWVYIMFGCGEVLVVVFLVWDCTVLRDELV